MLLRTCAERILDLADLENGELDFLASVLLRIGKAHGDHLLCHAIVDKNFEDVLDTALNAENHRRVWARNESKLVLAERLTARTARKSYA